MGGDLVDLVAWTEAADLVAGVVEAARSFRGCGAAAAADQIVRAAESIPSNIAEGYGRGWGKDGARFIRIARASAAELESHLRVAAKAGRLSSVHATSLVARARRVRALIHGLARLCGRERQ